MKNEASELATSIGAGFAGYVQAGILKTQQKDGAMWDFWIANNTKPYGTAFGIMGLEHTLGVGD